MISCVFNTNFMRCRSLCCGKPLWHYFLKNYPILKIVLVPDASAARQVPKIDGLVEYREDKQELYIRSNKTWNVLAREKKV